MNGILFRGKDRMSQRWHEGHLVVCEKNGRAFITQLLEVDADSWVYWEVESDTVGQYTGLKDKNGKKIFEGDILKIYYYGKSKIFGVVRYGRCRFYIDDNYRELEDDDKVPMTHIFSKYELEVVGNIYDNPEFLKGEEQ